MLRHRRQVHSDQPVVQVLPRIKEPIIVALRDIGVDMNDKNQIDVEAKSVMKKQVDEEEDDDEFEEVDDEVSFRSPTSHSLNVGNYLKPTENAYDYISLVSDESDAAVAALYQCQICTYSNGHKWKIANHIRNNHMKQNMFHCPYCKFVCRRKIEFCVHKTTHTNKTVFSCCECLYRTTLKRNYERHRARHRNTAPIKCMFCSYSSTGEAAIQRHMAEYHESPEKEKENMLLQQQVNGTLGQSSRGDQQITSSGNVEAGECDSTKQEEMDLQEETHTKMRKRRRMKSLEDCGVQENGWEDSVSPNYCSDSCDEQAEPLNLSVKKLADTDDEESPDEPLDLSTPKKSVIVKQLFPESAEDNLQCRNCSYVANCASDLRRHQNVHSNARRFECHLCDKNYKYKSDLHVHVRSVHQVTDANAIGDDYDASTFLPHLCCPHCSYVGKYPADIERHIHIHTGKKQWACVFCGYKSIWKGDMKRHLQKYHANELQENDAEDILQRAFQQDDNANAKTPNTDTICDKKVIGEVHLISADDLQTKRPSFQCSYCAFVCEAPSKLKCHMEIHGNLKRFMCAHCGRRSNWLWDVRKHIRREHPSAALDVVELPAEEARATLNSYMLSHPTTPAKPEGIGGGKAEEKMKGGERYRRYMCSECGRRSNYRWDLNKHIRTVHQTAQLLTLDENEARETRDVYGRCEENMGSSETESEDVKRMVTDNLHPFCCSVCGIRSNWRSELSKHIKQMHSDLGQVLLLTEQEATAQPPKPKASTHVCNAKSAPGQGSSQSHVDLSKLKRFKCSQCAYRSNFRSDIGRHIKRKHHRSIAKVTQLDPEVAAATLEEYHQVWARKKFVPTPNTTPTKRRRTEDSVQSNQSPLGSAAASKLRQHPEKVKVTLTKWRCTQCEFTDMKKEVVKQHCTSEHASATYMCKECGDTFVGQGAMAKHCQVEHNMMAATDSYETVHNEPATVQVSALIGQFDNTQAGFKQQKGHFSH